jgi:hypothetical protein
VTNRTNRAHRQPECEGGAFSFADACCIFCSTVKFNQVPDNGRAKATLRGCESRYRLAEAVEDIRQEILTDALASVRYYDLNAGIGAS